MKVSKDFILREIAGEYILVPTGISATKINGLITMNAKNLTRHYPSWSSSWRR